ncbi:family 10 glycosylhydrolase [Dolichospermum sp. ST_con]|nr:family 10 glycosylhydrolase [Dolichospermum sp. ST_con]MDD1418691.1 family 10 glycosylhydrolase [Dolichospermum sp. ST_sed1]MDD1424518.1 family 10 glycosylhydrolase [Dolichospermum sp. ST_sed9]MDD1429636.1 family 10 glycosylhydrolase [Dolichospermum sp. ST_sed6]MDD1440137.1 family 10 glycosylhydrolase [Dolichospermum sp. ST_sed3]MDD1447453.1 family 10 glycosylhydrolase [Dolichospermum sp. ST_sed8]MDD1455506.1 family 10 glycosylhydrolase [Dolichospermum sp. ST_sed7]MDD1459588.1 family 10 g
MNFVIGRVFGYFLCLGFVISLTIFPISANPNYTQNSNSLPVTTEIRGVWLTNVASGVFYLPWGIERAISQLAALNFNTIYPVVWNRGYTFYKSPLAKKVTGADSQPLLNLIHGENDFLAKLIKLARSQNLTIIPWFEYGLMTPPDSALAKLHSNWLTIGQKGVESISENLQEDIINGVNKQAWLNPLHPQVQNFIRGLILEVVKNYHVDGIQIDDHFGMPVQFGYDPFTVKLYQKEHQGKKPPTNLFDPEWMRWRANKITAFMVSISKSVRAIKPYIKISLSPNSQYFAYKYYLQDWETWVKQDLIDELILQVYRSDKTSFIQEISKPGIKLATGKIPVAIGISTGNLLKPVNIDKIKEQIQIVRNQKLSGFSFFYWESLWGYITPESPYQRRRAFLKMFDTQALRPLRIKKL